MKKTFLSFLIILFVFVSGCGYSTRSLSPSLANIKTIYIEPFKNSVDYSTERGDKNLYVPMMEVEITNKTIGRFMRDGVLKIAKKENADVILQGELLNYQRDELRLDDNQNVQEYRITIIVSITLWNAKTKETMWSESSFAGDTTYFVTGSSAKTESAAIDDAVTDLAQRIIERTVEDW